MSSAKEKVWKVWAMPFGEDTSREAQSFPCCRITKDYILVYSPQPPEGAAVEVGAEELYRLTGQDNDWLLGALLEQLGRRMKEEEKEIQSRLREKVEQLAAELQKEAEKEGLPL